MRGPLIAFAAAALSLLPLREAMTQTPVAPHGPVYNDKGELVAPTDYREWIYLSTGLDMSYSERLLAMGHSMFSNVFVNPEAYRAFQRTGTWPDKTMLVMELRGASSKGSINKNGHYQSGGVMGVEVHVKDSTRFDGGWAFFAVGGTTPAPPIPASAECYSCHRQHAAVDTTFVQFYPTLIDLATRKGTLSAAYLHDQEKGEAKR
jgi:Cytochrome P460